jgi:uncharacterized protein YfbU (UPF0304 family)
MAKTLRVTKAALDAMNIHHLFLSSYATKAICQTLRELCYMMEGFVITTNSLLDDFDRFLVYMGHFPSGASTQSIYHYA